MQNDEIGLAPGVDVFQAMVRDQLRSALPPEWAVIEADNPNWLYIDHRDAAGVRPPHPEELIGSDGGVSQDGLRQILYLPHFHSPIRDGEASLNVVLDAVCQTVHERTRVAFYRDWDAIRPLLRLQVLSLAGLGDGEILYRPASFPSLALVPVINGVHTTTRVWAGLLNYWQVDRETVFAVAREQTLAVLPNLTIRRLDGPPTPVFMVEVPEKHRGEALAMASLVSIPSLFARIGRETDSFVHAAVVACNPELIAVIPIWEPESQARIAEALNVGVVIAADLASPEALLMPAPYLVRDRGASIGLAIPAIMEQTQLHDRLTEIISRIMGLMGQDFDDDDEGDFR